MASTTERGAGLLALPTELRLRIYAYSLAFTHSLTRPNKDPSHPLQKGVNVSLLRTCKQVYDEARPIFFEVNRFRISYNHLCYCENRYPYLSLNQYMTEVAIYGFLPRTIDTVPLCSFCRVSGYGLLTRFGSTRYLREAEIHFEDIFSFVDNWPSMRDNLSSECIGSDVMGSGVGVLEVTGLPYRLSVVLPVLNLAWRTLVGGSHKPTCDISRLPGGMAMRRALEYLDFEANCYHRTARSLFPFFQHPGHGRQSANDLRGGDGIQPKKRLAHFTWAISQVLYDIFADDGGSITVDWVTIDGGPFYAQRLIFVEIITGIERI